ncbi:MAG: DUF4402 domain-containing protein [Bacteroidota bacterium]
MIRINKTGTIQFLLLFILVQLLFAGLAYSQPPLPVRTLTVNSTQALHFGSFCLESIGSSGGTVTVGYDGNRTSTGEVMLLNTAPSSQAAIYDVNLCQGRTVVITYPAISILNGSNGGFLTLNIGPTEKGPSGSTFQVNTDCSFITQLRVGGTLIVGSNAANPAGTYIGNFSIIFNQQ